MCEILEHRWHVNALLSSNQPDVGADQKINTDRNVVATETVSSIPKYSRLHLTLISRRVNSGWADLGGWGSGRAGRGRETTGEMVASEPAAAWCGES